MSHMQLLAFHPLQGQLYNLNSNYGNQQQLTELNRALREAGIAPLADIVINHRTASSQVCGGRKWWSALRLGFGKHSTQSGVAM